MPKRCEYFQSDPRERRCRHRGEKGRRRRATRTPLKGIARPSRCCHIPRRERAHCLLREPVAAKRRSVSPSSARDEPSVLRFRSASSRSIFVTWVVGHVCSARLEEERKTSIVSASVLSSSSTHPVSAEGLAGGGHHDAARALDGFELPVLPDLGSLREPSFRAAAEGRPPRVLDRCPSPAAGLSLGSGRGRQQAQNGSATWRHSSAPCRPGGYGRDRSGQCARRGSQQESGRLRPAAVRAHRARAGGCCCWILRGMCHVCGPRSGARRWSGGLGRRGRRLAPLPVRRAVPAGEDAGQRADRPAVTGDSSFLWKLIADPRRALVLFVGSGVVLTLLSFVIRSFEFSDLIFTDYDGTSGFMGVSRMSL
ncbi:hypothetical protein ISCGN_025352 [Ixodes scapularis]